MQISFSPPDISQVEIDEVITTLKSGWITTGPKTKLFEKKIADYCGSNKAVCLNSQTACAELTLRLLGIGPGDEVITSAYTYSASASVICHIGSKLILVDTAIDSYEMDYNALERAITPQTKAIIPVDIGGVPCDYSRIYEIVERKRKLFSASTPLQKAFGRIIICADAAHSFGAQLKGIPCGQLADFTSFSFHAVKNLTTAEGGAVTWRIIPGIDDEELYHQYMLLSLHGQSKDALAKEQLGAWEYDIVAPYYKCNMTDIMASLGLAQLSRYKDILARRRQIIEQYDEALAKLPLTVLKHFSSTNSSSGHLYMVRLNNCSEAVRNQVICRMAERGVATNVHYKPLPMHTAYKKLGFDIKHYPNAYDMYKSEITLPLHMLLSDEDVAFVIQCLKLSLEELKCV